MTAMGTHGLHAAVGHASESSPSMASRAFGSAIGIPKSPRCVDDLAVIRSCHADGLNHVGGICQMNTGSILGGRPSLGSWCLYGLGSECDDLPGYVVLTDNSDTPPGGNRNWGTGFMPAAYQGTQVSRRQAADPARRPARWRDRRRGSAASSTSSSSSIASICTGARGRQPARSPHRQLRVGLSHAVGRPRGDRSGERNGRHPRAVRPRPERDRPQRPQLPAGPPAGRARRALRAALHGLGQQVGRPHATWKATTRCTAARATGRSPGCSKDLEAPRPARQHAGDLGRRVRPHADERKRQRPRPQSLRLHHLDGRRRRAAAA